MDHFGWAGAVLHIDLTRRTTAPLSIPEAVYRQSVGGRGVAGHFLAPHAARSWDDPRMPLLLFTGPLVNTPSPTSGRMCIMSRSPLTGTVGHTSVGGRLATQLKRAGWDGIVVTGKCDRLTGIEIADGRCRLVDAHALAGRSVPATMAALGPGGSRLVVGPAAENGVRFASLMVDAHYAAGRNGLGLAFAVKNLKYLKVAGTGKTAVADTGELAAACADVNRLIAASPILMGELGIARFGTGALYDLMDNRKMMPTANFRATRFEAAGRMNAWSYRQACTPAHTGCSGCHIRCKQVTPAGQAIPEFETMSHFSALVENTNLDAVIQANDVCNALGMDTISAAAALSAYAEHRGRPFNPGELLAALTDMAHGRGTAGEIGRYDAAADDRSAEYPLMDVKGLALPAYDPRGAYGMALAYATSTRGGCHLQAYPIVHEILRKPVATDRFSFDGKARIIKIAEDANAMADSLTTCKFVFLAASLEEYARVYAAVTGEATTGQDLLAAGERVVYRERMMNARNGFDARHDDLPERFFEECGSSGEGLHIPPIDRGEFLKAREKYYRIRGLTPEGRPTLEKASALGLQWRD